MIVYGYRNPTEIVPNMIWAPGASLAIPPSFAASSLFPINLERVLRILGTATIIGEDELKEARAKRAKKDAAKEAKSKGKRSWKRKGATPEADAPEPKDQSGAAERRARASALCHLKLARPFALAEAGGSLTSLIRGTDQGGNCCINQRLTVATR
ncbi:hypothetical protein K505DRAFT_333696 [Melanomma pulvis-pyrius CBS 109.77]|uniref:Uncharacterized protein n=1 Tax=Melanomma pulvis-pyrius CBS 109.77 TaxID=1314802 RepID=A0A6A6XNP8_9PLEO|nr:hypothetical protein K505DRAFT_333696 [Melanomma pulvis-pyrius CBS 109.77]